MANRLPVVHVRRLADVVGLVTRDGPRRIMLERADSISEARAMMSVLRAKGVLRKRRGNTFPNGDVESADDDSEGSGAEDDELGREGGWGGWAAEQVEDPDLGHNLALIATASDDVGPDHERGGAKDAREDVVVADGWVVNNMVVFRRAVRLGVLLEEVAVDIVPLLVNNPADSSAISRLRTRAREIREVGKEVPSLMGQGPVTLGNHLKKVADEVLRREAGGAAWMANRRDKLLPRVLALYEDHQVAFDF